MLDLILVDYDPEKIEADKIVEAVKKAGYTAVLAANFRKPSLNRRDFLLVCPK